ncbi:MAG: translesion DNA synthesis-associated protein ImuA [Porticoccaceae bacterium]
MPKHAILEGTIPGENDPPELNSILQRADVWRASKTRPQLSSDSIASGHALLDTQLHYGGWPGKALTELFCEQPGVGEWNLLAPALSQLSQAGRYLFLVDPPHEPYAPALKQLGIPLDRLVLIRTSNASQYVWSCQHILRSAACGALLAWQNNTRLTLHQVRKLQLAARAQTCLAILLRPQHTAQQHSFAALRISVAMDVSSYRLTIFKQPGGWAGQTLKLPCPQHLIQAALPATELPVHLPHKDFSPELTSTTLTAPVTIQAATIPAVTSLSTPAPVLPLSPAE